MAKRDRLALIDEQEDALAHKEYGMKFVDLPGDIKQNLHNAMLKKAGLRQNFHFKCLECKMAFDEEVEGDLIEEYINILHDTHTTFLEGLCPQCKKVKEQQSERDKYWAEIEKKIDKQKIPSLR